MDPRPDGGATVHLETRQPLVYLDQWALYKFASDEALGVRLLEVFKKRGTLMFSWMNAAEIALLVGDSRKRVEAFLEEIGEHWFPLEVNADTVMTREEQGRTWDAPLDEEFVRQFYPHIHGQEVLSLSRVLELTANDAAETRKLVEFHKGKLLAFLAEKKEEVKKNTALAKNFATVPFEPARPTRHVYFEMYRPLVTDPGFNPSKNDMVDVFHAVVASAYCDVVLLDNKWAGIARRLQLPLNRLHVFTPNELDKVLYFMETAILAN